MTLLPAAGPLESSKTPRPTPSALPSDLPLTAQVAQGQQEGPQALPPAAGVPRSPYLSVHGAPLPHELAVLGSSTETRTQGED